MALEAKKIGVYIFSGDGIEEAIDCKKLAEDAKTLDKVALVKVNKKLTTKAGADEIRADIKNEGLTGVVIAASSSRFHTELFTFDDIVYDRVNLRELVAWTHEPKDKGTYDLALDYIRMGVTKVNLCEVPVAEPLDINETVLVVGGGYTGMNAALAAAYAGYPVILTEKSDELGGYFKKLYKLSPTKAPYFEPEKNNADALIAEVERHPLISVLRSCHIERTSGQPGMFNVSANVDGENMEFQAGAIVQATGWKPNKSEFLKEFHYGELPNIITNIEMEELAKANNISRPSDGKPIDTVVFVQCAGRDHQNELYCSSVCCMTSLKQAMYVREKYPNASIYIIYKDMRTPGQYEMFYKRVQNEENIFLTKGSIAEIKSNGNGTLIVDVDGTLLGQNIEIEADLVVLAQGMISNQFVEEAAEEKPKPAAPASNQFFSIISDGVMYKSDVLNLTYRQGPELPTLKYGFPDSHYVCFPYETRRTGIYAAGTVRSPMDLIGCKRDAEGAAMKAIQAIENTRLGTAVHPRSGDKTFPDFFLQRCTQCKRCTEECPFGTLDEDTKGTPKPNPNRCRRCGICMGACPERIISFKDYSVQIISAMIKSIYVPKEETDGEATPRIIAFMCENDALPSMDIMASKNIKISPYIRVIPVRCLGSVSTSWIADALSAGFDGAILIGCKFGDDYQCHFIRGSQLANRRMENVQEKLKQLVLEPERVEIHTLSIDEYDKIPDILNTFAKVVEVLGPNPYKEM